MLRWPSPESMQPMSWKAEHPAGPRRTNPTTEHMDYVRAIRSLYNTYNRQQESLTAGIDLRTQPPRG